MRFGGTRRVGKTEEKIDDACCKIILGVLLVGMGIFLFSMESEWKERKLAYVQIEDEIIEAQGDSVSPYHNNKIIKISSNNITADSLLNDFDFNLRPSNRTLKLKRESEYCQ